MAAIMIDYATLCRAIEDWKAGHQPSPVTAAPQRITSQVREDEEAVEYSAVYDTNDAPAVPDSTVVYHLPEYEEGEVEADDEEAADEVAADDEEAAEEEETDAADDEEHVEPADGSDDYRR